MIYKYTSCEAVIAKVMADLDIKELGQRLSDIREWIFEAVDKIGAITQYTHKESNTGDVPITILTNYQAQIPCDLVHLTAVAYSKNETGPWQSMRTNTGSFKLKPDNGDSEDSLSEDNKYTKNRTNYSYDLQYFIKPGWIVTNIREGYLKLSYEAISTDGRGYPLIPDLTSYQEAVYWYIVMKLKFPEYLKGNISANVYYDIRASWAFYRKSAYAEALMPNSDGMTAIKNIWNNLVPEMDANETFFSNTGTAQRIHNKFYGK